MSGIVAIGVIGQTVRSYVTGMLPDEIAFQLKEGEIALSIADIPVEAHRLSDDGQSLIAIPADPAVVIEQAWAAIRIERNAKLDAARWTISADSPLTPTNQAQWLTYLRTLNRLTIDYAMPASVIWPTEPQTEYVIVPGGPLSAVISVSLVAEGVV